MRKRGVVVRAVIITVIELQLFPAARLPAPYLGRFTSAHVNDSHGAARSF